MADVVKGLLTHEVDTNVLFEKFTIDEIRDIEKKTRSQIERKKEDLRQMVGERYRELIEAADTITEMKNCAIKVKESIGKIEEYTQNLKRTHMVHGISPSQKPRHDQARKDGESNYFGIAAQIKLLLDMPEKIWSAIDNEDYLLATRLYLLARHVNASLQMESPQSSKITTWFPVLSRQWATISSFRNTILEGCQDQLKAAQCSDQVTASCLASVMLLEDSTPRQVFTEFLLARARTVRELFQPDQTGGSVKSQVCDMVLSVLTTIHQVYTIFYRDELGQAETTGPPCNLLIQILDEVTSEDNRGSILTEADTAAAMKCLPQCVIAFRPRLKTPPTGITTLKLTENCKEWVQTCVSDVRVGVTKLLGYVNSVKGVTAIRDELWKILKEDKRMATWQNVCERVLGFHLSIWEEFLQSHFLHRVKVILQGHLDSTINSGKQQITQILADLTSDQDKSFSLERDLSLYSWSESSLDIPANSSWVPVGSKGTAEGGELLMKTRSFTPVVQNLCSDLDSQIRGFLEDGTHYLSKVSESAGSKEDVGPFDCAADSTKLQAFIQEKCDRSISKLVEHITNLLYASKKQLENSQDAENSHMMINQVLTLARFTTAVPELCPHLQKCMTTASDKQTTSRLKKGFHGSRIKAEDPNWVKVKDSLMKCGSEAYQIWVDHVCTISLNDLEESLLDMTGHTILCSSTTWEEREIKEETEDGRTVQSTIRVPMQSSWPIQKMLYVVCEEINRIGGHALTKSILQGLVTRLSDGVINIYKKVLQESEKVKASAEAKVGLTQSRALELLFDLRFLNNILARKEDLETTKKHMKEVQRVVDALEAQVDPFDLDVFSPFIQANLIKHTQRSTVLFGSLASINKQSGMTSSRPAHTGGQEQHNVLPIITSQVRFPLLPLSVQKSMYSLPQPKPKLTQPVVAGPSSPPPVIPAPETSSSFLGSMSTIWFTTK